MSPAPRGGSMLSYRRVLVIEDDPLVASAFATAFADVGAQVVGPVGSLGRAIEIAETAEFDCALVDLNLKGVNAYPVVDILMRRNLPFAFISGCDRSSVPAGYRNIPFLQKPVDASAIARALAA